MSSNDRQEFIDALKASTVVDNVAPPGALALPEVLGTRSWFDARRTAFRSSGGRPTDPRWSMKRAIPFAEDTWDQLNGLAKAFSESSIKIGPGQVAACLIEEAVRVAVRRGAASSPGRRPSRPATNCGIATTLAHAEPRYRGWRQRGPFAGVGEHQ
jgi:hypothetical protein